MKHKKLFFGLLLVPLFLLVVFITMQFSEEVNWSFLDFLIMGILLSCTIMAIYFTAQKVPRTRNKIIVIAILVLLFILVWAELAVGIFGSPFAGS